MCQWQLAALAGFAAALHAIQVIPAHSQRGDQGRNDCDQLWVNLQTCSNYSNLTATAGPTYYGQCVTSN